MISESQTFFKPSRYRNASPRIPKYQFTLPPSPLDLKLSTTRSNRPIVSPNPWPKSQFLTNSPPEERPTHDWKHTEVPETLCRWYTYPNIWWYASFKHVSLLPPLSIHVDISKAIESGSNTSGLTFVHGLNVRSTFAHRRPLSPRISRVDGFPVSTFAGAASGWARPRAALMLLVPDVASNRNSNGISPYPILVRWGVCVRGDTQSLDTFYVEIVAREWDLNVTSRRRN